MRPLVIVLAVLLAACAAPREWTKPGATAADLERDTQACQRTARVAAEREAFRAAPVPPPQVRVDRAGTGTPDIVRGERPGSGLDEAALRAQYFNQCMQELGYQQEPVARS